MKRNASRYALYTCGILSVILLSGCAPWDWFKEKFGGKKAPDTVAIKPESNAPASSGKIEPVEPKSKDDKVLVRMEGIPVMTINTFEEEYENLLEENPQLKQMSQLVPNLKENIFKSLLNQLVMNAYVERKGIDESPEYKEDLARFTKSLKRMLNSKYFSKGLSVSVSDAEIKKFYEENKDKAPGLIASQGGVRAVGVKFDNEAAAKAFLDKVKGKSKQFDEIAKADELSVQDFKLVNDQSLGMNADLRKKIMSIKSFPAVNMFKVAEDECWVVNATAKEAKEYRPYEEVKDALKTDLEREKESKAVEAEIEKLENEYKVEVDEEALKVIAPPAPEPEKDDKTPESENSSSTDVQKKDNQPASSSTRAA